MSNPFFQVWLPVLQIKALS